MNATIIADSQANPQETRRAQQKITLEPGTSAPVSTRFPNVDLTQGAWRVRFIAEASGMRTVAEQNIAIRPWMGAGPFPKDFDKSFPPEQKIDPSATYRVLGSEQPKGWKPIPNEPSGLVNLAAHFKPKNNVSAYAAIVVHSPDDRQALLTAGSDDGIKIWINGKQVVSHDIARGASPGDERSNVDLRAGDNQILIRITQGDGGWGFYCDLLGLDGQSMYDLKWKPIKESKVR